MQTICEYAYAKINLTLDITGKREDGYHTIDSIMQTVTLADTVQLTCTSDGKGITFICDDPSLSNENNLCCKAAYAFMEAAGWSPAVHIELYKKIPVAAGLGGGSADAAAVLRALNKLYPKMISQNEILEIAAKLGADVPFCYLGGSCRARGIGDQLEPISQIPKLPIVIARYGEGISTAEAYRLYDKNPNRHFYTESAVSALASGEFHFFFKFVSNGFESAIFPVRPETEKLCRSLSALGAITSHMSGSGSAVFGIFDNINTAESAAERLRKRGAFAEICRPCEAFDI